MIENKKDNMENTENLSVASDAEQGAAAQNESGSSALERLGKFKSVDALLQAYNSLQAEFTRRSQRLKELEKEQGRNNASSAEEPVTEPKENASVPISMPENVPQTENELYCRVNASAEVKKRIIDEYLDEVKKGAVPLMGNGVSVVSPAIRVKNIAEAGKMALSYLKNNR